jgi:hypothetical protein
MVHPLLAREDDLGHPQTKRWLILEGVARGPTNKEAALRPLSSSLFLSPLLLLFIYFFNWSIGI